MWVVCFSQNKEKKRDKNTMEGLSSVRRAIFVYQLYSGTLEGHNHLSRYKFEIIGIVSYAYIEWYEESSITLESRLSAVDDI